MYLLMTDEIVTPVEKTEEVVAEETEAIEVAPEAE